MIIVATGGSFIVLQVVARQRMWSARSPALALEVGDNWYCHALTLARLLEQLRRDDLVAVTIPQEVKAEIDATLKRFWDVQQVEE